VFADGGVDGGAQVLPFFLGAVALLLVLLALAMRNLPFPPAETSTAQSASWCEMARSPAIWLCGRVLLVSGSGNGGGGWIGSYVSRLERAGRRWRR